MNTLKTRNQAVKDVQNNKITPSEYWTILKSTWTQMTDEEKRDEFAKISYR